VKRLLKIDTPFFAAKQRPTFAMIVKKLYLAFVSAFLILPVVTAQRRDRDRDDDDDYKSVLRPPALRPGEKPADADFSCPYVKGYEQPVRYVGSTVRLLRGTKIPTNRCRATLTSSNGNIKTVARDWALTIDKISGTDLNEDGKAELVIDGYSGGERCCFTYTIVALGGAGRVIQTIESGAPLTFEKQQDGTVLIRGIESSLDHFLVPHSMAVVPQVLLRMQGDSLVNVSADFQPQYDKLIEEARGQLTDADIEKFRQSRYNDKLFTDQLPTVRRVLIVVLNYLYSGREDQAWRSLEELWPSSDQSRVKALILQRRERGLLKQLTPASSVQKAPE
jgi:hypothetical protein